MRRRCQCRGMEEEEKEEEGVGDGGMDVEGWHGIAW
jgi:hypothetical protein